MVPTIRCSGKGETIEREDQWLPGGGMRGDGGWTAGSQRMFKAVKLFCMILSWWIHDVKRWQNPENCTAQRLNPYINYVKWSESHPVVSDSLWPHGIVHGVLQARILERVAVPFSWGSSQPRDRTQVSHIAHWFFTSWATREAQIRFGVNASKSSASLSFLCLLTYIYFFTEV